MRCTLDPAIRRTSPALSLAVALAVAASACVGGVRPATGALPAASASEAIPPVPGYLVIAGGGQLGPEIVGRFIELAGGPDAEIVVIPTAGEDSVFAPGWSGLELLTKSGARNVTLLHTRDPHVAQSDSFSARIRRAKGVWFPGGRQWRLVDAYLGTRTERALHDLLQRGGAIGGTSAGASIMASYLVRGAREGNTRMMAPGYERGFGFLRGVAIDQHVSARKRERDLQEVISRFPRLLGLGLDEGTAIVVHGTEAEVIGRGTLFVHNGRDPLAADAPYVRLQQGEVYDLARRQRAASSQR